MLILHMIKCLVSLAHRACFIILQNELRFIAQIINFIAVISWSIIAHTKSTLHPTEWMNQLVTCIFVYSTDSIVFRITIFDNGIQWNGMRSKDFTWITQKWYFKSFDTHILDDDCLTRCDEDLLFYIKGFCSTGIQKEKWHAIKFKTKLFR